MRLIKNKSYNYQPFNSSLKYLSRDAIENGNTVVDSQQEIISGTLLEKYSYMIQNIISYEKQIGENETRESLQKALKISLKRILPIKEAGLMFLDEYGSSLIPFDKEAQLYFTQNINTIYREGILDWVFENAKPTIIPEVNNYTVNGPKLNFIFYPIFEKGKRKGLLAILTPAGKNEFAVLEEQCIQVILNLTLARIEKIYLKEKLTKTYNELQTYQAKLRNDFRLSAIGELTEGIVEDIKSPLQVILSYADLLSKDENDNKASSVVKEQVKKINFLVNRLVKFSSVNEEKLNIKPCDLNAVITDYYNLVRTSLENVSIECILDFEKDIPPILSHQSYLYQLFSTLVNIIKSSSTSGGGIIIQTRYVKDIIQVKFINTAYISPYNAEHSIGKKSPDLNLKIVENLMKLHEGELRIESFQNNSSVIILKFPLKRKIRK